MTYNISIIFNTKTQLQFIWLVLLSLRSKTFAQLRDFLLKKFYLNNVNKFNIMKVASKTFFVIKNCYPFQWLHMRTSLFTHLQHPCPNFRINKMPLNVNMDNFSLEPIKDMTKNLKGPQIIILHIVSSPKSQTHIDIQTNNFLKTPFNNFNIKTSIEKKQ